MRETRHRDQVTLPWSHTPQEMAELSLGDRQRAPKTWLPSHSFHKFAWGQSTRAATRAKSKEPENLTRHKEPPNMTISQGFRVPRSPRGGRSSVSSESHQRGGLLPLLPTSPPSLLTRTLGPPSCPHHWFILQTHRHQTPQRFLTSPQLPSSHPAPHFCLRNIALTQLWSPILKSQV